MPRTQSAVEEHNAEEIAKLERWRRRVALIYYASIIEMPIAVIVPCVATGVINMHNLGLHYAQISMLLAILLPLIGLAGMLLMRFDFKRSWRCLQLARLADELGLRYTHKPAHDEVPCLNEVQFMNLERVMHGGLDGNLLTGAYKKHDIVAVDYSYNHQYGNSVLNTQQTVAVFTEGFESLPEFVVVKQLWVGQKLEQLIAGSPFGKKFKVPDEDEFNQHFIVAGKDRQAVLACLTNDVIDILWNDRSLTFLVQDGNLMVARQGVVVAEKDYEEFLKVATKLARALERTSPSA